MFECNARTALGLLYEPMLNTSRTDVITVWYIPDPYLTVKAVHLGVLAFLSITPTPPRPVTPNAGVQGIYAVLAYQLPLDVDEQVEHIRCKSSYTWSDRCSSSSLSYRYRGSPINGIRAFTRWVSRSHHSPRNHQSPQGTL